jgi:dipeptidase E
MRLYLSSFNTGNCPQRLVSLAGYGTRVALVLNALDNFPRPRAEWLESQTQTLRDLGFVPEELDLRDYFNRHAMLEQSLHDKDLLWINGGNAFVLRRAMRQSGFDSVVPRLLASDRLVYAGFSAAVCCASPSLRGVELVDDPSAVPERYLPSIVWDGLRLIDDHVAVHYKSDHAESIAINKVVAYYETHKMPYRKLRDGEALVVDGIEASLVG